MCLHVSKFLLKINEFVAPDELHLFVLDEIGDHNLSYTALCASMHTSARNSRNPVVVDQEIDRSVVCEEV